MIDSYLNLSAQIVAIIASIVPVILLFKNREANTRKILKSDLEILKMLNPNDKSYQLVKNQIDQTIENNYGGEKYKLAIYHWTEFILGILMVAFSYFTYTIFLKVSANEMSFMLFLIKWFGLLVFPINGIIFIISSLRKTSLIYLYKYQR